MFGVAHRWFFNFLNQGAEQHKQRSAEEIPFEGGNTLNLQLCRGPAIFWHSFPYPTLKLRPREGWWSAQVCRDLRTVLSVTSSCYLFNHPTSGGTMNYWICNIWNFKKWHWCVPVILHQMTVIWSQYIAGFSNRKPESTLNLSYNERRPATKIDGQNTGFGLCNSNSYFLIQPGLRWRKQTQFNDSYRELTDF